MHPNEITVIIPTLNEDKNIGKLCDEILKHLPGTNILVVDDGSKDTTKQIVLQKGGTIRLIDRTNEDIHGLTISIRDGIHQCETKYFMVIDGDFQHPPESLLDALECFKSEPDLVIGYRIKVEDWPFFRKLMSFSAVLMGKIALLIRRRKIPKDIMSGFFGGKLEVINPLIENQKLALKGYKLLFDLLKVFPRDAQIEQFGYVFKNREFGDSKIGKMHMWEYFKSLF